MIYVVPCSGSMFPVDVAGQGAPSWDLLAGLGPAAPGGFFLGWEGPQEGSGSPLLSLGPFVLLQESSGAPWAPPVPGLWNPGLGFSLAPTLGRIWSCRIGIGQELQPRIRCCWGSRGGGWSFELDFNLNHKSLDPGFIFEGRFFLLLLSFCLFFFFNQAAT